MELIARISEHTLDLYLEHLEYHNPNREVKQEEAMNDDWDDNSIQFHFHRRYQMKSTENNERIIDLFISRDEFPSYQFQNYELSS